MKKKINLEQILQAAEKLSNKKGLLSLDLKDIAAELNIKSPSLYNHVAGINDLYEKLALSALTELSSALTKSAVGREKRDALEAVAQAYFHFAISHSGLYEAIENPRLTETAEISQAKEALLVLLRQLLWKYEMSEQQEIHVIRILRSFLHGFVSLQIGHLYKMNADINESFMIGLTALLSGLQL